MMGDKSFTGVVAQREALGVYIEALLNEQALPLVEVKPSAEIELAPTLLPPVVTIPVVPQMEVVSPPEQQQELAPSVPLIPQPELEVPLDIVQQVAEEVEAEALAQPLPPGVPEWAATPFQALLFKVSGLTLAVPLAELSGVQEWENGAVTPMLGKIEWYLGVMAYRGRRVPVIDTAQLVLPAERLQQLERDDVERLGHVVFIQDGSWGLACDSVDEVIGLDYQQVKWRTSRSKRRWLAGTVLEKMCAIIDPFAFGEMLQTGLSDLPESSG